MTVNVPLLPRQGSGSSSDPYSQLVSSSLTVRLSSSLPSSTQSSSTPTQSTDPQSSSTTSSSTTFSSFTSSTSASSPDDRSSTSATSTSVTVSSSMATSSSFGSPSSGLVTPPSNPPLTSSTGTPASNTPDTSVTGTGVPRSLTVTTVPSSAITASPPPSPTTTNDSPSLSSTISTTIPTTSPASPASPTLPTSTIPVTSSPSTTGGGEDPVGGNLSVTTPSAIITTSASTITSVGGSTTPPAPPSSSPPPGFPFSDRSSGLAGSATSSSGNPFSLTQPVTFTTTNPAGSTITTVPDFFTTVFTTTRANGQSTTVSQIVINPTGILSPGDNRPQNDFFRNQGAVAGVFIVVGLTAIAIVILGTYAIWKRRRARLQREVDLATGGRGASRARSPLEPDEAGQDPGIYAVAARHSPVEMRSGAPGPGEEESGSFGYGPSVFGSAILLNPPAQVANAVPSEQRQYPYFPSGRRSPSPGEAHPSFARGMSDGSNAPPAYFSAPHSHTRMKTPSPVFGGPLVSVPDSPTSYMRGAPPSAYGGAIFSNSKQPSSEGHGSSMENKPGPGLESTNTPSRTVVLPPMVAYAYEPEPVTWRHRIVDASPVSDTRDNTSPPSPRNLQVSTVEQEQDPQSNRGSISNRSASVYSQDWEAEQDVRPTLRVVNDPRISPELGMRLRGGLASEHSFGPRDSEDWTRRVGAQMIANDSTLQVANPAETNHPAE